MAARCVGFNQISDLSAAAPLFDGLAGGALTAALAADHALIQAQAQDVRWTCDGTPETDGSARADGMTPTASAGMLLAAGDVLRLEKPSLGAFLGIEVTAGAKLAIHFFKTG
jgi:hypothetical protein